MSTQSSSNHIELHFPNPEKSLQFRQVEESESGNLFHDHIQGEDENAEDVQMADHLRPMEELLRIPIVGIENSIVVPAFSLKGAAETWLENEPPNSITSWDDLTFTEAWERFKDLLRKCPHHGFSLLHQIDFFYNGLSQSDQDFLNTAASGNLMSKNTHEALTIIENKAKVRTCRNKSQVSSSVGSSTQIDAITALTKQVEALISSMQEAYNRNQEASIQLMQTQMGQMEETFQERPSCVPPKKEQEPKTITEVVEIASSQSTPLVPPPETPPLSTPKPKENLEPNPHHLLIQEENFQALENPTGRADHFVYRIDIVDSLSKLSETMHSAFPKFLSLLYLAMIDNKNNINMYKIMKDYSNSIVNIVCAPHTSGILMSKNTHEALTIIENKAKVRTWGREIKSQVELSEHTTYPTSGNSTIVHTKTEGNLEPNPHHLLIQEEKIQALESLSPFPTPFGDSDTLLEETDTLLSHSDDSLPDYETFCFDIEEKSGGSTTTHSDYSLSDYEIFYFDENHIEEKSSGSTTTHSNFSLPEYDLFIFDLSINPLPPADRSDSHHEEFADELAHIISPPEYDRFYFDIEPDLGELTILFEENLSKDSTKELTSPELNYFPLLLSDCDSTFSKEFSEIDLLVSFPYGNKDKIFDPGIFIIKGVQSKRFHILPLDDFSNISFVSNSLLLIDPSEIETFLSFPSGNENKVFDSGILIIEVIFSFTRKFSHLLIDNFLIDNCHILSEISLKIVSSINFHPKDKEIRGESS
ncbi:hypothetical protein Tco_0299128 [Tanacetum coccineum]